MLSQKAASFAIINCGRCLARVSSLRQRHFVRFCILREGIDQRKPEERKKL